MINKQFIRECFTEFNKTVGNRYFLNSVHNLSEKFEDDKLTVAISYRKHLIRTVENYGGVLCHMTLHNTKVSVLRELTKPVVLDSVNPCTRCGGTGLMPFKHVKGGTCFKCNGTGSNKK